MGLLQALIVAMISGIVATSYHIIFHHRKSYRLRKSISFKVGDEIYPSVGKKYLWHDNTVVVVKEILRKGWHKTHNPSIKGPSVRFAFENGDEEWFQTSEFWNNVGPESSKIKYAETIEELLASNFISADLKKKIIFHLDIFTEDNQK